MSLPHTRWTNESIIWTTLWYEAQDRTPDLQYVCTKIRDVHPRPGWMLRHTVWSASIQSCAMRHQYCFGLFLMHFGGSVDSNWWIFDFRPTIFLVHPNYIHRWSVQGPQKLVAHHSMSVAQRGMPIAQHGMPEADILVQTKHDCPAFHTMLTQHTWWLCGHRKQAHCCCVDTHPRPTMDSSGTHSTSGTHFCHLAHIPVTLLSHTLITLHTHPVNQHNKHSCHR